ncbi:MAG TPA: zinc ribbon domain-containing protein [Proteobacteria bacterium]|nr:zinc ribbon domain-containing protein [Pseudomonadota bacterium]
MPIYEYQCEGCEYQFDIMQKINDAPLTDCPECGGTLRKLVSSTTFILKGGGWYATDYGKNRTSQESKPAEPPKAAKEEAAAV